MMKVRSTIVAAGVMVLALGAFCFAGPWYTVTDLGTLGGTWTGGLGISNAGHCTGGSDTGYGEGHAYLWENGVLQDLGTLPGHSHAWGEAPNSFGQVAGGSSSSDEPLPPDTHAFLWLPEPAYGLPAGMSDLGTLPSDLGSLALDINESGQVVGRSGTWRAFLWENGVMTELPTLGGEGAEARGVNDLGQVVGWSFTAEGGDHACLWENGVPTDLGQPFGSLSAQGREINNQGQIAGFCSNWLEGWRHACLWEEGVWNDLGTLGSDYSRAYSINEAGQVVGDSTTWIGEEHAYIWQNGVMYDLNNLVPPEFDWELWVATDINDSGQIIAKGTLNGAMQGFLLTPMPIPSPGAVLLGILGVGVVGIFRRIRRR